MARVKININYGGFIGADEEYYVDVPDDATQDEIESECQDFFEEQVLDNCGWEIISEDEDDE